MDIYNPLNISIGTVMKDPEIVKFVPDYLKTKKMCKHAVKMLLYLLRSVLDQYQTTNVWKSYSRKRSKIKNVCF